MNTWAAVTPVAPTAVFRADADLSIGGGHVMRCLTLADELARHGWRCTFAASEDSIRVLPALERSPHSVVTLPTQRTDQLALMTSVWSQSVELLVFDHYGLDAEYERVCRRWAQQILVVDDLANRAHDADVLLDQGLGRDPGDYCGLVADECTMLCGSAYILLKSQFYDSRASALERRKNATKVERILIAFGSVDTDNATMLSLKALQATDLDCAVDVVLGAQAPHREQVRQFLSELNGQGRLHVDVRDMSALMVDADIGIAGAGGTVWEFCGLGLPTLVITLAANQQPNAAALRKSGAARVLGSLANLDLGSVTIALREMVANAAERGRLSDKAASICDCQGAERVADILQSRLSRQ